MSKVYLCKVSKYFYLKGTVLYVIDDESSTPLHIQLYLALKKDIINNYTVGQKLPSIRKIATLYNLGKNTVQSSYDQLYAEGYIESRPKSGYFVSDIYFDGFKSDDRKVQTSNEKKEYIVMIFFLQD